MRSELQQKWIDALKSGKYNQTTGVLHDQYGFCCLGVVCDVIEPNWDEDNNYVTGELHFDENGNEDIKTLDIELNDFYRNKLGLTHKQEIILIKMNDKQNKSFIEIAEYLESIFPLD